MDEITSMEFVAVSELDLDCLLFNTGYGDLILSYLRVESIFSLFVIVDINDEEELWQLPEGFFEGKMETARAHSNEPPIGHLSFGEITVEGILFRAVIEQVEGPMVLYISAGARDVIMDILHIKMIKE